MSMACMNLGYNFMTLRWHICGVIWRESKEDQ